MIGPEYIQAPEVDGTTEYTDRIDFWSAGIIICDMLIPEHFERFAWLERPRNPNLGPQLVHQLKIYGRKGNQESSIAGLARLMISVDPSDRPDAAKVFAEFPEWDHKRSEWVATSSHSDGPLTKKAKASDDLTSSVDDDWLGLPAAGDFKGLNKEDEDLLAELGDLSESAVQSGKIKIARIAGNFVIFAEQARDPSVNSNDGDLDDEVDEENWEVPFKPLLDGHELHFICIIIARQCLGGSRAILSASANYQFRTVSVKRSRFSTILL
ncbi:MAG: hypothetical protein Q9212_004903 [Teloschistes hypoglaucus]